MNVIVIGAGVVGCAIAHELSSRGARVRVIDSRGTGLGATRASAGILAPTIEGHVPALIALGVRSLGLYEEFISRVSTDAGQAVEYERSGTLQVALNAVEAAQLCTLARAFGEAGVKHVLMEPRDALKLEPSVSSDITRALFVPQHGYVAVGQLTGALAQAALNRGAVMSTTRVISVEGGDAPAVTTADETFQADAIVIAAGSWTDQIESAAGARDCVKPIRGQLLQVHMEQRPAGRVIWGSSCYVVPWRDGSALIGATVEDVGFDESATAAGVHDLLTAAFRLMPAVRAAKLDEVRVGLRPMTADELPAVGRSSTMRNVFYAVGHYRNGVLLAPLTASLVADLVITGRQDPDLALVRPDRLGL